LLVKVKDKKVGAERIMKFVLSTQEQNVQNDNFMFLNA